MTVDDLRKLLADAPGDAEVLISGGPDHSYYRTAGSLATVARGEGRRGDKWYAEWRGPEHASPGETPIMALVIDHE